MSRFIYNDQFPLPLLQTKVMGHPLEGLVVGVESLLVTISICVGSGFVNILTL
jgi:hypothetical protein